MEYIQLIGIGVVTVAYGLMWFLLLKSKGIIETINRKGLTSLREIEEELDL